jgi:hypothetical protein
MLFTGGSIQQATQIGTLNTGVSTINTSKLNVSVFDLYKTGISSIISSINTKDGEQDTRLGTAEGNNNTLRSDVNSLSTTKVNVSVYNTTISSFISTNNAQDSRLTGAESYISTLQGRATIVEGEFTTEEGRAQDLENQVGSLETNKVYITVYDAKISSFSSINGSQNNRLTYAESNINSLQNSTSSIDGRASSLDNNKVNILTYNYAISSISSTNIVQDSRLTGAESYISTLQDKALTLEGQIYNLGINKVNILDYNLQVSTFISTNTVQDGRLTGAESNISTLSSIKQDLNDYTNKINLIDAKDVDQDNRLSTIKSNVSSIQEDIAGRVETEILAKVPQFIFDTLKSELDTADSILTNSLATKVVSTIQQQVDAAQNTLIDSKVAQNVYNSTISSISSTNASQETRLSGIESSRLHTIGYDIYKTNLDNKDYFAEQSLLSIYEFIQTMLNTYEIFKPDGSLYQFTGNLQNLLPVPNYFNIASKSAKSIGISLSNMLFNSMLGDFVITDSLNNIITTTNSSAVSSSSLILTSSDLFNNAQFPLKVAYRDSNKQIVSLDTISSAQYNNLPLNSAGWVTSIGGTSGDDGKSVAVDGNGNVYVIVNSSSSPLTIRNLATTYGTITGAGSSDCYIIKYNSLGQVQWATNIGGTLADSGNSIAVDGNGNVYVTGTYNSTSLTFRNFSNITAGVITTTVRGILSSGGTGDCFIAKLSTLGEVQWATNIVGNSSDQGLGIAVDKISGDVYVTGLFNSTASFRSFSNVASEVINTSLFGTLSASSSDTFIAKYNTLGLVQWATNIGGTNSDQGNSIAVYRNSDGTIINVYVTGIYASTASFRTFSSYTAGGVITTTVHGTLAATGTGDCFIAKYNTLGQLQWATNIGGSNTDQGLGIAVDNDDNVYVTGTYVSISLSIRNFTSLPLSNSPISTVLYGTLANSTSGTASDIFIAKYSSLGQVQWATSIAGAGAGSGNKDVRNIAVDAAGNVYITGFYSTGGLYINNYLQAPVSGGAVTLSLYGTLSHIGSFDCFIVKYNTSGSAQWATSISGNSSDQGQGIAVDTSGNVYVTGIYSGNSIIRECTSQPVSGGAIGTTVYGALTNAGGNDCFIVKYNTNGKLL